MSTENLKKVAPNNIARGQNILLKAVQGEQVIKAQFLSTSNGIDFTAALEGSTTGFPFEGKEWEIYVKPKFEIPERTDIETLIYNLITQGQVIGQPPSFGDMAQAVIDLIKGEIPTPVKVFTPPQPEPTAEFEAEAALPQEDGVYEAMPTYDVAEPDIDILDGLDQASS